jgi:hypothetical protein
MFARPSPKLQNFCLPTLIHRQRSLRPRAAYPHKSRYSLPFVKRLPLGIQHRLEFRELTRLHLCNG